MVEVIPTILTTDPREAEEKIARLEGLVKKVQIDVIDGVFAQNKTIEPSAVEGVDTGLVLDFHLMTKEPADWVERAVRAGADRIIGQIEMMTDQVAFLGKVQEAGILVGLAIDLPTPVSSLEPTILNNLDVVLVMSVKAGFGGQGFDNGALAKIKELNALRAKDTNPFRICVDGGVTPELTDKLAKAGVDEVAVGRRLFSGDLEENLKIYGQGLL
jgi:ribulose-phosphate 3-epimerase